jgi:mRNA interferase MazF
MHPSRGDVWWVAFEQSIGGEIQKTRPAIVISNDAANAALNRVVVVPITSNVARVYPGETIVTVNGEQRKAMADQIMAVSKQRLSTRLSFISRIDLASLEDALLLHLAIKR